jgi:pimeloyl-ACP methyl ester carboxylesterase
VNVFYLHGFASSSQSTKAAFFADQLKRFGIELLTPDFNEPDFASLTMTRMLTQLDDAIVQAGGRAVLIGSSLGGALAILAAARLPEKIDRLVLLAPAVMFGREQPLVPPEGIDEWRRRGAMPLFHYGYGGERMLNFGFYEDTLRYDACVTAFSQPAVIFQGRHDTVVDPRAVDAFARGRGNVTLTMLDDDHQLLASLPSIWQRMEAFLGLTA